MVNICIYLSAHLQTSRVTIEFGVNYKRFQGVFLNDGSALKKLMGARVVVIMR